MISKNRTRRSDLGLVVVRAGMRSAKAFSRIRTTSSSNSQRDSTRRPAMRPVGTLVLAALATAAVVSGQKPIDGLHGDVNLTVATTDAKQW